MTIMGRQKVYGYPNLPFGAVITGIDFCGHSEAMLLELIIHKAMRDMAGLPAEKILARWSNSIADTRARATRECWTGWDLPNQESTDASSD